MIEVLIVAACFGLLIGLCVCSALAAAQTEHCKKALTSARGTAQYEGQDITHEVRIFGRSGYNMVEGASFMRFSSLLVVVAAAFLLSLFFLLDDWSDFLVIFFPLPFWLYLIAATIFAIAAYAVRKTTLSAREFFFWAKEEQTRWTVNYPRDHPVSDGVALHRPPPGCSVDWQGILDRKAPIFNRLRAMFWISVAIAVLCPFGIIPRFFH